MSNLWGLPPAKWSIVLLLFISLLVVSCNRKDGAHPPANAALRSITVSPPSAKISVGQNQQFVAMANYSDGTSKPLSNVKWATSNPDIAAMRNLTGLFVADGCGRVTVSATSEAVTGTATLTVSEVVTEGDIPADFGLADAMTILYGNFDRAEEVSTSALPVVAEKSSSFEQAKGIEARPFFLAEAKEAGVSKVLLVTYASPLGQGFSCHGCVPLIGMAVFIRRDNGWVVESSTKAAVFSGTWGKPPRAHLVHIGSDHVAAELEDSFSGQGAVTNRASILVPWKGEIREALDVITFEGNGGMCGDEGMLPCVESSRNIAFVKRSNPDYDDIVLTLSGTRLSDNPPYKVIKLNETERRVFSEGKYVSAD